MDETNSVESSDKDVGALAKDIVRIERQCFYGDESERDRLRKIRERLNDEITQK